MFHKLSILSVIILCGCSQPQDSNHRATVHPAVTLSDSIPAGFSVIEQHPNGYFIRLASAERADATTIHAIAATFSGKFDRVDLCLDVAHERGDEYTSIIGYQVFDHENDNIYTLN
jgi:lipoprotein